MACLGLSLAVLYSKLLLPRHVGGEPNIKLPGLSNGMVIIPVTQTKAVHIHHWMICAFVLFMIGTHLPKPVYYFLWGMMIQGLLYADSFTLVINRSDSSTSTS